MRVTRNRPDAPYLVRPCTVARLLIAVMVLLLVGSLLAVS